MASLAQECGDNAVKTDVSEELSRHYVLKLEIGIESLHKENIAHR